MKRINTCFAILVATILSAFAQIPQTFSYQAVVRDNNNRLVVEQPMEVYVQILQGSDDGFVVYSEKHYTGTNQNGLMTFELGGGETTNNFASIDWINAPYFVRTIINFDDVIIPSVTPLLAVPYALYAAKAGNAERVDIDLSDYAKKTDIPAPVDLSGYAKSSDIESNYAKKSDLSDYVLASQLNEYVSLSYLSNNYVKIADVASRYAKNSDLNDIETIMNTILINLGKMGMDGSIKAKFSISNNKYIYFSQGNLQYQASSGRWRFAEHQWDYIGTQTPDKNGYYGGTVYGSDNRDISSTYNGWIDLFGWGTSGYDDKFPYMTSENFIDYGDELYYYDITKTDYDWGYYNAIINGGNVSGMWRTITSEEMDYILNKRTDAENKKGIGVVNDILGLILLPDEWTTPKGLYAFNSDLSQKNIYTTSQWAIMEANGAVFLPAAGTRFETKVSEAGKKGHYWTSSIAPQNGDLGSITSVYLFYSVMNDNMFEPPFFKPDFGRAPRSHGLSVRLIKDVK